MLARHLARAAAPFEAVPCSRTQGQRHGGRVHGEAEPIPIEIDLGGEVDIVLPAGSDEVGAFGAQKFRGLKESQARQFVEERQLGALLRQHEIWNIVRLSLRSRDEFHLAPDGLHDRDPPRIDYLHL